MSPGLAVRLEALARMRAERVRPEPRAFSVLIHMVVKGAIPVTNLPLRATLNALVRKGLAKVDHKSGTYAATKKGKAMVLAC